MSLGVVVHSTAVFSMVDAVLEIAEVPHLDRADLVLWVDHAFFNFHCVISSIFRNDPHRCIKDR